MDPAFIEERRHFLQLFLELCIEIPHIYYSGKRNNKWICFLITYTVLEEFQVFLRTKSADVSAVWLSPGVSVWIWF